MHVPTLFLFVLQAAAEAATFSLPVRHTYNSQTRNGPAALRNAYWKHGMPVPQHIHYAARRRSINIKVFKQKQRKMPRPHSHHHTHSRQRRVVSGPSDWDIEYLSPVIVGSQTLQLNLDTGSADLWVFSNDLDPTITISRPGAVYAPGATATNTSDTWSISYSDGSYASGRVVMDTVSVGNTTVSPQAVEMASKISNSFVYDEQCDGILGLAFGSINTVKPTRQKTFFGNALPKLPQGLFTVDLRHNAEGSIDFGFINTTKYTGSITYPPLRNSSGFWQFQTSSVYYINSSKKWASPMSRGALADTGTTLLLMKDSIVSQYYKSVKGGVYSQSQGGYVFPVHECAANIECRS